MTDRYYAIIGTLLLTACSAAAPTAPEAPIVTESSSSQRSAASAISSREVSSSSVTSLSIYDQDRITKKPFGIYITPQSSPVEPEIFTGYHTGTDYEVLPDENEEGIVVTAICSGQVIYRNWVQGYGGVAVQQCVLDDQKVTVLYGHLDIDTVVANQTALSTGATIGYLGRGYSEETSNERPHLHLGIHRGTAIELKGYARTEEEAGSWLDAETILYK